MVAWIEMLPYLIFLAGVTHIHVPKITTFSKLYIFK